MCRCGSVPDFAPVGGGGPEHGTVAHTVCALAQIQALSCELLCLSWEKSDKRLYLQRVNATV